MISFLYLIINALGTSPGRKSPSRHRTGTQIVLGESLISKGDRQACLQGKYLFAVAALARTQPHKHPSENMLPKHEIHSTGTTFSFIAA